MRLSSIVLILALTCLPVHGQDQVKHLRGDKEAQSKATANLPEAETPPNPIGAPTREVEPPQVPKDANEEAGEIDGPEPEAQGEWVWIPSANAMEGPEGDWDMWKALRVTGTWERPLKRMQGPS